MHIGSKLIYLSIPIITVSTVWVGLEKKIVDYYWEIFRLMVMGGLEPPTAAL